MSRSHPQNGPSFNKATYKKPKPPTDEELAEYQKKQKAREAELIEDGRRARNFSAAVRDFGNRVPLRGPDAVAFQAHVDRLNTKK
jgi:hypothetical protein